MVHQKRWSGSVRSKDRKLSGVLNRMQRGDSLIVTEISRSSRTMLEIMTILNSCIKKEEICSVQHKRGDVFQNDMNSKVLGFAFGLMAEIERNLISMRTKEALARRRQEGVKLGRKKGTCPAMRVLRENKRRLIKMLNEVFPVRSWLARWEYPELLCIVS